MYGCLPGVTEMCACFPACLSRTRLSQGNYHPLALLFTKVLLALIRKFVQILVSAMLIEWHMDDCLYPKYACYLPEVAVVLLLYCMFCMDGGLCIFYKWGCPATGKSGLPACTNSRKRQCLNCFLLVYTYCRGFVCNTLCYLLDMYCAVGLAMCTSCISNHQQ